MPYRHQNSSRLSIFEIILSCRVMRCNAAPPNGFTWIEFPNAPPHKNGDTGMTGWGAILDSAWEYRLIGLSWTPPGGQRRDRVQLFCTRSRFERGRDRLADGRRAISGSGPLAPPDGHRAGRPGRR